MHGLLDADSFSNSPLFALPGCFVPLPLANFVALPPVSLPLGFPLPPFQSMGDRIVLTGGWLLCVGWWSNTDAAAE